MPDRSGLGLERGERLHYRGALRRDGEDVAVTEDRVVLRRADEVISVRYESVSEINHEQFDWFLGIISGSLTVFGLYSMVVHNPLVGAFFALAGLWSIRRSYRFRDLVRIHTHNQPKPLELYPEDVDRLYLHLEPAMDAKREELEAQESDDPSADTG